MILTLLKISYLRLKYRFLPNKAQAFWAQELLDTQGMGAKLGQILSQGKKTKLPKSTLSPRQAEIIFLKEFKKNIPLKKEILSASMGQVFCSVDNLYAIKILHPGIKERLKNEIDNILILGGYFSKVKGFTFSKNIFRRFLEEVFEQETDLKREAHFQEQFFEFFRADDRFKIPRIFKEYSSEVILTQEFVPCTLAQDLKKINNYYIFDFFFKSLFIHGVLPGDLNDRNWGINDKGEVIIYDYGCSQIVSERRISGLIKLILNQDLPTSFLEFGVRLETTSFKGKEQILRDALFDPLFTEYIDPHLNYSHILQDKFQDQIKELRAFTDPWVLLIMRSLFSLIRVYQQLDQTIPLQSVIKPYLVKKDDSTQTTKIKIEVLEGKKLIINMTLPMSALENLGDLIPENVTLKMKSEGIEISKLINQVKDSNFAAQSIFDLKIDHKSYRVWTE
jgi:predicted unusual protein kinase regulating ubiquinone biosynthesis (AarF/ABC1/UbiB family)